MFLNLDDLVVRLDVQGPESGPPLLLLHSIGTGLHVFDPQVAALSRRHRVIRADMRGHGLTTATLGDYSMSQLGADAFRVLDALGLKAAHVVGLSIGGRIALQMAAEAPERVLSLCLLDTALEFPPPQAWQDRIDAVRAEGTVALVEVVMPRWVRDPSLASSKGLRHMLLRTDRDGYAGAAAALRDCRAAELAGRIACPTTVVVGEADIATPPEMAQAVADLVPGSRLISIPEAAHIPTFEQAEATTRAILDHMARVLPAPDGLSMRKSVLGDAHVGRASAATTDLDAPFQEWITAHVWGGVWTRPGLDRRTRSMLTLAMMAALGRQEEFELHVRATRNTGVTEDELSEILLQVGAYAGVPAANSALKIAKRVLKEG